MAPKRGASSAERDDEEIDREQEGTDEGQEDALEGDEGEGSEERAAGDAAEYAGEEQEADEGEDVDEPPQRTRGGNRIQALANEVRELRQRLQERREPDRPAPSSDPREETDDDFNNRVALLPPDERMEQRLIRSEQRHQRQLHQIQFSTAMQADKAAYEAKSAYDKRYARWKDAVEAKHAELVARGQLVEREVILKVLIGERVLGAKGKETEKQRERGQEALRRQRTSPPAGRGDAGGRRPSGDSPEARRRRLDGMEI